MKVIEAFNNTKSCKMTIQHHQILQTFKQRGTTQVFHKITMKEILAHIFLLNL
jgi:hypothetical protein